MKITSRSNLPIQRLLRPPTLKTGIDEPAPAKLTIRRLMTKRFARLRQRATIAQLYDGRLVCIGNLERLGFDFIGKAVAA